LKKRAQIQKINQELEEELASDHYEDGIADEIDESTLIRDLNNGIQILPIEELQIPTSPEREYQGE